MALTEVAAMGIACILTHGSKPDTEKVWSKLSETDRVQVTTLVVQGSCLPDSIEKILARGKDEANRGDENMVLAGSPTMSC